MSVLCHVSLSLPCGTMTIKKLLLKEHIIPTFSMLLIILFKDVSKEKISISIKNIFYNEFK